MSPLPYPPSHPVQHPGVYPPDRTRTPSCALRMCSLVLPKRLPDVPRFLRTVPDASEISTDFPLFSRRGTRNLTANTNSSGVVKKATVTPQTGIRRTREGGRVPEQHVRDTVRPTWGVPGPGCHGSRDGRSEECPAQSRPCRTLVGPPRDWESLSPPPGSGRDLR